MSKSADPPIGTELFAEEEARLSVAIGEAQRETDDAPVEADRTDELARRFDEAARLPATLYVDTVWKTATEVERSVQIDEFIEEILVSLDCRLRKMSGEQRCVSARREGHHLPREAAALSGDE
jgi:hypothetical protein